MDVVVKSEVTDEKEGAQVEQNAQTTVTFGDRRFAFYTPACDTIIVKQRYWLILILVAAAFLRLYNLGSGDPVNDEVFSAFRGIAMMDFDEAEFQTTPLEWFDAKDPANGRWWMNLSFHDHPPLVFAVQHVFMRVFGENNFAFRLPSALLGIASVYLLYAVGVLLFAPNVGVIAAALMAVTLNHVYVSRVGLQESYVIFFILLTSYFFIRALKNGRDFMWAGVAFGLGLLAKYTVAVIAPILVTYAALFRRDVFRNKFFWLGGLAALAIFSPVILYNIGLYQATGHFDFQLSYIVGQDPEVWSVAPGKNIGTLGDRIANFIPRLIATNSWLFLALFGIAVVVFFTRAALSYANVLKNISIRTSEWFLIIALFWTTLLILKIGPSYRFLTMLTPWMALVVAVMFVAVYARAQGASFGAAMFVVCSIILAWETAYAVNNELANYPHGSTPLFASKVRYENYNWGYNELGDYFANEFAGKAPAITFDVRYRFLERLRDEALAKANAEGALLYPAFVVAEGNFDHGAKLWVLDRLNIYHAWPIISGDTYRQYLKDHGVDYFARVGFKNYYFIMPTNSVLPADLRPLTEGTEEVNIKNKRGDVAFKVYVGAL
ncbi:MAG: glycosyltransferase family 39 protein [bacterium]|nr:glycosyltransferase family 39 protein [bacterium]